MHLSLLAPWFSQSVKECLLLILKNYKEKAASQRKMSKDIMILAGFSRIAF
jgi:hypothetical protein